MAALSSVKNVLEARVSGTYHRSAEEHHKTLEKSRVLHDDSSHNKKKLSMKFSKPKVFSVDKGSQLTVDTSARSSFSQPPLEQMRRDEEFSSSDFKKDELECLNRLQLICREKELDVSNQLIYRFAIFHGFNVRRASSAIVKKHDDFYLSLRLTEELVNYMEKTRILFPLPGLKSAIGSDVIYWHPSRFISSATSNRLLVESMCYVLNEMSRTVDQCRNGILMIVNMDGYKRKNFHRDTQMRLTKITEGHVVPSSIVQILIVNPPKLFKTIWNVVWPAHSALFSRRFHMIKVNELGNYLMEGYGQYLPQEFDAVP